MSWNLSYPNPIHFRSRTDSSYSETKTLQAECCVANALAWNFSYPNPIHFCSHADSSYFETEILQADRRVPRTMGWNLSHPNPIHFLPPPTDSSSSKTEILQAERCVLETLGWKLGYPIHFHSCADPSYSETMIPQVGRCVLNALGWNLGYPNPNFFAPLLIVRNALAKSLKEGSEYAKRQRETARENLLYLRDECLRRARCDSLGYLYPARIISLQVEYVLIQFNCTLHY